jgi:plastocyanin
MRSAQIAIAAGMLAVAASVLAGQTGELVAPGYDVTAEVSFAPATPAGTVQDASAVVVWLVAKDAAASSSASGTNSEKRHYRMAQRNKRFEPHLLVLPVGSIVDFPNLDPWFHNVFSLYRGKRFDLGLYQAGSQRSVRFDRPGPSYLFCNIHPEMTGVILAIDSPLFGVSDKAGHVTIRGVPAGKYVLHVWYEHTPAEALQSLQRLLSVDADGPALLALKIPVNPQEHARHKNKYGEDYEPKAPSGDY